MTTRAAVRILVAGLVAATALGAGTATTAHRQREVRPLSVGNYGQLDPPAGKWPACPNCFL